MTFSIVGIDAGTGDIGVAVASKYLAAGAVVPYVRAGVGAVATQSYPNPRFGPLGLAGMQAGRPLADIATSFRAGDPDIEQRQYGLVSAAGESLTFTGRECYAWAGGLRGDGYAIQGNMLTGSEVAEAMRGAWLAAAHLALPHRLLAALQAGDAAGGDRRGRQAAALVCAGKGRGPGGLSDDWVNLRADDHPSPCAELKRLLGIFDLLMGEVKETRPPTAAELAWLRALLVREGYAAQLSSAPVSSTPVSSAPASSAPEWDGGTEAAAKQLYAAENIEARWVSGGRIDPAALAYLQQKFG